MFKSSSQHVTLNLLWGFSDAKSLSLFRTKRRISSLRSNDTDNSSLIAQIYCASKAFGNEERRQSVHSSGPRKAYNIDRCRPYMDAARLVSNKSNFLGSRIADASYYKYSVINHPSRKIPPNHPITPMTILRIISNTMQRYKKNLTYTSIRIFFFKKMHFYLHICKICSIFVAKNTNLLYRKTQTNTSAP